MYLPAVRIAGRLCRMLVLALGMTASVAVRAQDVPPASPATREPRLVLQTGHQGAVIGVAFSPDRRQIVSAGDDDTLRVWDTATGRLIYQWEEPQAGGELAFTSDGRYVLSDTNLSLNFWAMREGKRTRQIEGVGNSDAGVHVALSPDARHALVAVEHLGGADEYKLWDTGQGTPVVEFSRPHEESLIDSLAFDADLRLALVVRERTIQVLELKTGELLRTLTGHSDYIRAAALSPDGRYALTAASDQTVRLWDVSTGAQLWAAEQAIERTAAVAFSPDGHSALFSGNDKKITEFAVPTQNVARVFVGHARTVRSMAVSADGQYLVSGSSGGGLIVWNRTTGERLKTIEKATEPVVAVSFSPDGSLLFAARSDRSVLRWDLKAGKQTDALVEQSDWDRYIDLGPQASGEALMLHRLQALTIGSAGLLGATHAAFSADTRYALQGGSSDPLLLWDLTTMRAAAQLPASSMWASCAAISPDNRFGLSGSDGAEEKAPSLRTWNLVAAERTAAMNQTDSSVLSKVVTACAISPDGRYALSGSRDRKMRLWDLRTGREVRAFSGHYAWVNAVAFSPNGKFAVSGGQDGKVKVWDLASGKEVRSFEGHRSAVNSVAFSPDGRLVASGGGGLNRFDDADNAVRLWDIAAGKQVQLFFAHSAVTSLAFLPAGRFIAAGTRDGAVMLWPADPAHFGQPVSADKALCTLVSFRDGTWAVLDAHGRFDTNNLEEVKGLHWILPEDPLRPLPLEIFMRDYYEPGLLPRVIEGDSFLPVADLSQLNTSQPQVAITSIDPMADDPDAVSVTVQLSAPAPVNQAKADDAVYDFRLFRNGKLVAYAPQNSDDRNPRKVALDSQRRATLRFDHIRLPHDTENSDTDDGPKVEFSAYAFNNDRVKSATARRSFKLPQEFRKGKRRAYLISFGVNTSENPLWNLHFAANDARLAESVLGQRLRQTGKYDEVVSVALLSDDGAAGQQRTATKDNLRAVLALLAGSEVSAQTRAAIPNGNHISKAAPDDLVMIIVASHGYASRTGAFYLFPYDVAAATVAEALPRAISSDELSQWLRDVDAGEIVLILDACYSAAAVLGPGFKPGPLGSRGLGQLAYDKGMRILAATQADTVALESRGLQHGLLTAALLVDGIEKVQAEDPFADGAVLLQHWLKYGTERVPELYTETIRDATGTHGKAARPSTPPAGESQASALPPLQIPALFDFSTLQEDVMLAKAAPSGLPPFHWEDKNNWLKLERLLESFCTLALTPAIREEARSGGYVGLQTLACKSESSNRAAARLLWQQAAEQQWPAGIYRSAVLESDPAERRKRLEDAVQYAMPQALYDLALMLAKGQGGPVDAQMARMRLLQAAELGHPLALARVAAFHSNGDPLLGKGRHDAELSLQLLMEVARIGAAMHRRALIELAEQRIGSLQGVPSERRAQAMAIIANFGKQRPATEVLGAKHN